MNQDEQAVAAVLSTYEQALNHSSTEDVLKLYTSDGVFMPQHFPSSVGESDVRIAYDAVFSAITLAVKFTIAEVRQVSPYWAIARTNSAGTVKVNASGATTPEANQELFVFQKVGGDWKIARYCFSTINPPREQHSIVSQAGRYLPCCGQHCWHIHYRRDHLVTGIARVQMISAIVRRQQSGRLA
jgi:uncharacterized protein (TIGR02246 family)